MNMTLSEIKELVDKDIKQVSDRAKFEYLDALSHCKTTLQSFDVNIRKVPYDEHSLIYKEGLTDSSLTIIAENVQSHSKWYFIIERESG